jgi:hypothetical protein
MLSFKMFGFSAGVGEVALVALPALPAVLAVGTAAGFVVPGFPAIAPLPRAEKRIRTKEVINALIHSSKRRSEAIKSVLPSIKSSVRSRDNALLNPPPLGS